MLELQTLLHTVVVFITDLDIAGVQIRQFDSSSTGRIEAESLNHENWLKSIKTSSLMAQIKD